MVAGRVRRSRQALLVAVLASFGAACSFVTSLDGLTGGPPSNDASTPFDGEIVVPPHEGIPPSRDAASDGGAGAEAAPDADAAGSIADATSDDASDASKSDAGFCASLSPSPLFCDDFDEYPLDAAALAAPWDQVSGSDGTVVRNGATYTSPPLSMLVTSDPNVGTIDLAGYKTFKTAPSTATYTLSFDIDVVAADTTGNSDAILAAIELFDTKKIPWALQFEVSYDSGSGALYVILSLNQPYADGGNTYTGPRHERHVVDRDLDAGVDDPRRRDDLRRVARRRAEHGRQRRERDARDHERLPGDPRRRDVRADIDPRVDGPLRRRDVRRQVALSSLPR